MRQWRLDRTARRLAGGTVLLGGSPMRLFRLGPAGVRAIDRVEAGEPVDPAAFPLIDRLVDAGALHPVPDPSATIDPSLLTVVVPAYGPPDRGTLDALVATGSSVIVVDDASPIAVSAPGCTVVRRPTNGGPGAARNTGLASVTTELVAFVDTDCVAGPRWL